MERVDVTIDTEEEKDRLCADGIDIDDRRWRKRTWFVNNRIDVERRSNRLRRMDAEGA